MYESKEMRKILKDGKGHMGRRWWDAGVTLLLVIYMLV